MASEIRVNQIQNRSGLGTVTFSDTGVIISGVTTISDLRTSGGALTVGTGASVSSPATNVLTLGTNNSERVRIGSTGSVGIGTNESYGDSNASFTSLSLGGNGTRYGLIELNKSDGIAGSWIDCYGTGGNGDLRITTAGTSGAITFWTGGAFTEKVRIDSSGNIGIGSAIPENKLDVNGTIKSYSGASKATFKDNQLRSDASGTFYFDHGTTGQSFTFRTSTSSSLDTTGPSITSAGNISFPSGFGIDFSATANSLGTMTSELLSDYEEGTWTPTFPNGGSVTTNYGSVYTRIGRVVHVSTYIAFGSIPNNSSVVIIAGLPYNAAGNGAYHGGSIGYFSSSSTFAMANAGIAVAPTTSNVYFYNLTGTGGAQILNSAFSTAGVNSIIFSVSYTA